MRMTHPTNFWAAKQSFLTDWAKNFDVIEETAKMQRFQGILQITLKQIVIPTLTYYKGYLTKTLKSTQNNSKFAPKNILY